MLLLFHLLPLGVATADHSIAHFDFGTGSTPDAFLFLSGPGTGTKGTAGAKSVIGLKHFEKCLFYLLYQMLQQ